MLIHNKTSFLLASASSANASAAASAAAAAAAAAAAEAAKASAEVAYAASASVYIYSYFITLLSSTLTTTRRMLMYSDVCLIRSMPWLLRRQRLLAIHAPCSDHTRAARIESVSLSLPRARNGLRHKSMLCALWIGTIGQVMPQNRYNPTYLRELTWTYPGHPRALPCSVEKPRTIA